MWTDIIKRRAGGVKVYGDILRETLNEYLEETNFKDNYVVRSVVDEIFETYMLRHRNRMSEIRGKILVGGQAGQRVRLKQKVNTFAARYFPDTYELKRTGKYPTMIKKITEFRSLRSDEDLEKIRTRSGDRLKLRDWEEFKRSLRAGLNATVPRDIYNRKSNVRLTDGDFEDNKAVLNVSFRSLQGDRRYIHINFIEEDGDYYFTTIEGNIQLFDSEVIQTEAQLREQVIDLVEEIYTKEREEYDLRDKEEDELTEEENIRQLEAANPDSYWDKDRAMMVPKEKPPEEELPRNLNLEEASKLGAKAKEKADKLKDLLAEKRSKKGKGKDIKPLRGKRGRRDVS